MRVRAIRSHFVDGRVVPAGEVYEIADPIAHELISAGRAVVEPAPVLPHDPPRTSTPSKTVAAKSKPKSSEDDS